MVSNIRSLGDKVEDAYKVKKWLQTILMKFLQISLTIEKFGDPETMTVEEVAERLKAHEERIQGHSDTKEKRMLLTHQECLGKSKNGRKEELRSSNKTFHYCRTDTRGRGRCHGRNHRGSRGGHWAMDLINIMKGRGPSRSRVKSKLKRFNCDEHEHYA